MKTENFFALLLCGAIALNGCVSDKGGNPEPTPIPDGASYFDFATTTKFTLSVTYPLASVGYTEEILFEVFTEDPDKVYEASPGNWIVERRTDITAIFKAFTVGARYTGTILLPTSATTLWVCTSAPGLPQKVEVPVIGSTITVAPSFTNTNAAFTKGVTRSGENHSFPDDMFPIDNRDDWDNEYGIPSYLNPDGSRKVIPTGLLADVRGVLPEDKNLSEGSHAYLLETATCHDISLVKSAKVDMVFINDGAALTNTVGYYIYPTATPPTKSSDITRKYIAFPNSSAANSYGALIPGDYVRLKWFDGSDWHETIPAGHSIGFFLQVKGFDGGSSMAWGNTGTGNIREYTETSYRLHFSDPKLNYPSWVTTPDKEWMRQQTVALYDYTAGGRELVVIGFEDMNNGGPSISGDHDFNDVVFYIEADPTDAIEVPDNRDDDMDPDPTPTEYSIEYYGTLAFEDLWPYTGDYDMNDVGIEYYCQVFRNTANKVTRVVDQFIPVHKGATYENGFGYQYGVAPSAVKSMNWNVVPAKAKASYNYDGVGLETGQSLATVMLFSNVKDEVDGPDLDYTGGQQSQKYIYTIATEFNSPQEMETVGFPPYNPFIVVKPSGGDARNREVHLPNYRPTALVDATLFGTGHDKSDQNTRWYVSATSFPFAINIPVRNFDFPKETVRIDNVYSKFNAWVSSGGTSNADWYIK